MTEILLKKIQRNPQQPRKRFDQAKLEELAQSIQENGLIQPIRVEDLGDGNYMLVAGERRLRAHELLGRETIEAMVVEQTNHNGQVRLAQAFVENVQREDMNAMEISNGYAALLGSLGSVKAVCKRVGKSSATVYSFLALQEFEPEVQAYFENGSISVSPITISALKRLDSERRLWLVPYAAARGLSSETLVRMCGKSSGIAPTPRKSYYVPVTKPDPNQHFDALSISGTGYSENIREAARNTCKACELYDMASPSTCRECPMVDFLRKLR